MKKTLLVFELIFCLIVFSGCTESENTLEDKTNSEIQYLEDKIITITNKYVKDEYNDEDLINWEDITKDSLKISDETETILIDISEYEIDSNDLIKFREELNNLSLNVSNEDEAKVIDSLSYLYSYLPVFLESYSTNYNEINTLRLKSLVMFSLDYAYLGDWDSAQNAIGMAESKFNDMMNNMDYMKEYSYEANKIYVLIEELKDVIVKKELELVKIKYINFMENIS